MRPDRLLLQDILESVREISQTMPKTRQAYDRDKLVRSHLVRHIQIIGEAASRLSEELKERHPQVPWRAIAGMRHVIVHNYFEIDWNEVYNTAHRDVPALELPIAAILQNIQSQ